MNIVLHSRQTTWGGGEVLLAQLADHLRAQGAEVAVNAPDDSELRWRVDNGPRWETLRDAIHVYNDFGSVWRLAWRNRNARRRVFICHGWWQTSRVRNLVCRALSVRILAVSSAVRTAVLAHGFVAGDVPVVPFGPAGRFQPATDDDRAAARQRLGLSDTAEVVVWVGRYQDIKRPELFVSLVRGLSRPEIVGLMVVPALAASSHEHDVHDRLLEVIGKDLRIRLLKGEDPQVAFHAADAMVSTSEFESLGIAMMEAMACGLPCLTTARGGPVDFVEPAGRIIDSDSGVLELERALAEVLDGDRARQRADALTVVRSRTMQAVVAVLMGEA